VEDEEQNQAEILRAIELAKAYPQIVKIIAVGNEAMVKWQAHYVSPAVILRWVAVLKEARLKGEIPKQTLITCSDNWAALGGEKSYRNQVLEKLIGELDYLSLHTYAFHDSYYYPALRWGSELEEQKLPLEMQVDRAVDRAVQEQANQYQAVADYINSLGLERAIHIGETGWASLDNSFYGDEGTCVADEYIASVFYEKVHQWVDEEEISCFYFEAFDEPWKSAGTAGSEGHFGLFTVDGRAKYALWDMVDEDVFKGLMRDGNPIRKTYDGDFNEVWSRLNTPRHFKFKP
jgi:exo-beta-1,3-glucanase (GH17 family)